MLTPIDMLANAGAPVKSVVRTGKGWKLSAPHREDKHPSFSIFRLSNDYPEDDPRAWGVRDWAEDWSMSLARYLREYWGAKVKVDRRESKQMRKPTLAEQVLDRLKALKEGQPIDFAGPPTDRPYEGHGFRELQIDSRKYGVYLDTDGKPVIIYRNAEGQVVGVKKRKGDPKAKYLWLKGSSEVFWARRGTSKKLIVAEGEFKAIALAELFPDYDAVGMPSRVALPKAPVLGYEEVIFFLDPDVAVDLSIGKFESLEELMYLLTLNGIRVKVVNQRAALGYKDVNDALEAGWSPNLIRKAFRRHMRRARFREEFLLKHMVTPKGLTASELQLFLPLFVMALSRGKFVNKDTIAFEVDNAELMMRTKMSLAAIYRAFSSLKEKGLIDYKNGYLGNDKGKRRVVALSLPRLLPQLLLVPTTNSLIFSPQRYLLPATFPLLKGNRRLEAPLRRIGLSLAHLVAASLIRHLGLSRHAVALALRLGYESLDKLFEFIRANFNSFSVRLAFEQTLMAIERYIERRNYIIARLRRFMPGTILYRRAIMNPQWDFILPYSALFSGEVV